MLQRERHWCTTCMEFSAYNILMGMHAWDGPHERAWLQISLQYPVDGSELLFETNSSSMHCTACLPACLPSFEFPQLVRV